MSDSDPLCRATNEGSAIFDNMHSAFSQQASEEFVVKKIQGTDLEYVGQGDARVVLLDRKGEYLHAKNACVVKIHKHGDNKQNAEEVRTWQKTQGETRKHLLRITDWDDDYRWLVQPYIDTDVTDKMMIEMEKTFIRNGWKPNDVAKRNAARVKDRAVLVDYGQGLRRIDPDVMSVEERLRLIDWKYD
jgi:hypothetical protein